MTSISSCAGGLGAESARDAVNSLPKSRAPMPMKAISSSGILRLWLEDGLLHKYVLTVVGSVFLSIGKKEIKKISTVTITDVGSRNVKIPANAKAKLETEQWKETVQ